MRSSVLFNTLQNLIEFKPSQKAIGDIIGVRQNSIAGRVARDAEFSDDEIEKIERHYGVSLRQTFDPNSVELNFYENVTGSCGLGCMVLDESHSKLNVPKDVITSYSASNKYSVILAKGNSMQPEIMDNDRVIIKMWDGEQIIDNRIYLFRYNDEIFLKKLCKNFDQLIIISNNPRFPDRFLEGEKIKDLQVIGEVVGLMRNF